MAIADTITSMQTHTSNAYTMIGYGTDLTGINKNLANLSSTIFNAFLEALRTPDTLFTNLPKKSGSGSNITLNDTANAPMRIELGASELTQASTPTPSSPQDIHTISGDNKVVVNGKNLLPNSATNQTFNDVQITINEDKSITLNGTASSAGSITIYDNYNYKLNGTYTLSTKVVGTIIHGTAGDYATMSTVLRDYSYNNIIVNASVGSNSTKVETQTLNATCKNILLYMFEGAKFNNTTIYLQLEKGNQATTYEPYISQEAEIDLKSKNLFKGYAYNITDYATVQGVKCVKNDDGTYTLNGTSTGNGYIEILYKFGSGTTGQSDIHLPLDNTKSYTMSFNILSGTTTDASNTLFKADSYTLTLGSSASITNSSGLYRAYFQYTTGITMTNLRVGIQIQEGARTKYIPYYDYGNYSKIGNYEDKFIRTSGKNLFDANVIQERTHNGITMTFNGQTIHLQGTTTGNANFYLKSGSSISLKAGTYFITRSNISPANLALFSNNVAIVSLGNTDISFTLNQDTIIDGLTLQVPSGAGTINKDITIMLNKGTTALPYEPYGSNEWYIKKNIGKVVLDGTEDWTFETSTTTPTNRTVSKLVNFLSISQPHYISDKFVFNSATSNRLVIQISGTTNTEYLSIEDSIAGIVSGDSNDTKLQKIKTWLSSNNTNVYYILATPTYTQITGTLAEQLENVYQKLLSYSGTTNISQVNNDLPFVLSVQAIEV